MKTFDEALTASEEMFENNDATQTMPEEKTISEEQTEENESDTGEEVTATQTEQDPLAQAAAAAELAAQTAQQKDAELQKALQQIEALQEQNKNIQEIVKELSNQQKEEIVKNAMELPSLDVNSLAFADEETAAKAQADYAKAMIEYAKAEVLKEMEPFVSQAREGMKEKERSEVISALKEIPELQDIDKMLPRLEGIIKNTRGLDGENVPMEDKLIAAFMIARGADAVKNPPKEPTAEELMTIYENNAEFRELVEKKRLQQIKESQQVPPLSSSSGAVNAALNIEKKPESWEDASERTKRMFGM